MATNHPSTSASFESTESTKEDLIKYNMEENRRYLFENVDPIDFLMSYPFKDPCERSSLHRLLKGIPSRNEKWQNIYEAIDKMSSVENRYTMVVETLQEEGYKKVAKILLEELKPVNKDNRKKLDCKIKVICQSLELKELLPHFRAKNLITDQDCEILNATLKYEGNSRATLQFVERLPGKHIDWFVQFLTVLEDNDHSFLAEIIDPEMVQGIKRSRDSGEPNSFSGAASCIPISDTDRQWKRIKLSEDSSFRDTGLSQATSMIDDQQDISDMQQDDNVTMEHVMQVQQDASMDVLDDGQPSSGWTDLDITSMATIPQDTAGHKLAPDYVDLALTVNPEKSKLTTNSLPDSTVKMELLGEHKHTNGLMEYLKQPSDQECKTPCVKVTPIKEASQGPDLSQFQRLTRAKPICSDESKPTCIDETKPTCIDETTLGTVDDDTCSLSECVDDDADIPLREYQKELANAALTGKNVIIVAPTGCGKTRVAFRIIQEHMRKMKGQGIAKVVFLVNQVNLANQQGEDCREMLKYYQCEVICGDTQRTRNICLKDFVNKRDIFIVTPQVLLDALVNGDIESINVFSLLVFDECHHTHANHLFNQIMSLYMELKLQDDEQPVLPQIVGLTASVGVGKARNVEKAVEHIKRLMANLDTYEICTVNANIAELRKHVSVPEEEICLVQKRENDLFGEEVVRIMNKIEKLMDDAPGLQDIPEFAQLKNVLKAPADKGNAQYTQWVSKLRRETAKIHHEQTRRYLNPCRILLVHYNNALIIYNDARTKDALAYLQTEMKKWQENSIKIEIEKILAAEYEALRKLDFEGCSLNPKLKKLYDMVTKAYSESAENSRGIVFVKTRDLAQAIVSWMKETPGLQELNPISFLGQSSTTTGGGMTKGEQDNALKYFKKGKHKLIVATSVAEEGLDISKCNLVIRYDHVTNEIAMVQSRGRGRAKDSKYIVLAEEGKGVSEKEELNMIREVMMRNAIKKLQEDILRSHENVRSEIENFQKESNLDRKLKSLVNRPCPIRTGEFELRCYSCSIFVCMSTDIKKIKGTHHVVTDETLSERVEFVEGGSTKYIDDIQFTGKLNCKKCGDTLGVICIHRNLQFPVLKIGKLIIVDMNDRNDTCKKWNKAPFIVKDLTQQDLENIYEQRKQDVE